MDGELARGVASRRVPHQIDERDIIARLGKRPGKAVSLCGANEDRLVLRSGRQDIEIAARIAGREGDRHHLSLGGAEHIAHAVIAFDLAVDRRHAGA